VVIDLKEIISISGHSGLFKSIKPTRHGLVVESLDDQKKRSVKQLQDHEMTTLEDIAIYTTGQEKTLPLSAILWRLYAEFAALVHTDLYDTTDKLSALMRRMVPGYDPQKVHVSHLRKIVHWYNILVQHTPELFGAVVQDTTTHQPNIAP
jgi:Domain of unknown function (DUF5606)